MTQFRKGDLVECVDASDNDRHPLALTKLVLGELYTITFAGKARDVETQVIVDGVSVDKAPLVPGRGWRASSFRLVHRPDARFADAGQYVRTPVSA